MAFRGRRGGFRDTSFNRKAKHTPYQDFPENVTLPNVSNFVSLSNEMKEIAQSKTRLEDFWKVSCYYLQEDSSKTDSKDVDNGQFFDKRQKTESKHEALASYLKLVPSNFPVELLQGSKRVHHIGKKLRWDRDTDGKTFDKLEKLEEKFKDQDENTKKKGEKEEGEESEEQLEEESSDDEDDDYAQNFDFDDDEDDMNMAEEEEEDVYE